MYTTAKNILKMFDFNNFTAKLLESFILTQPAITCSKLTIKTLEQGMKYVQS